jgi:diguanylate cyclase (GGDEF)-like protein
MFDPLTGLPSRLTLEQVMRACRGQKSALILIGLDGFGHINRLLGDEAGELLLREAASRIFDSADPESLVARIAGDEFAVFLPNGSLKEAQALAEKLVARMHAAFLIGARQLFVSASVGIAVNPAATSSSARLVPNALDALAEAREQGTGRAAFSANPGTRRIEFELLGGALKRAVADREFHLVYRPRIDLHTGCVTELEAQLRWNHSTLGCLAPASFVPVAERLGLMAGVRQWVLDEACRQLSAWHACGEVDCAVAVDVSLQQITSPGFVTVVLDTLQKHHLQPWDLTLEMSGTDAMRESEASLDVLRQLAAAGVRIALDDFAVGQSSVAQSRRFPISELKIDRAFIAGIAHDRDSHAIVRPIVSTARSTGAGVAAESVQGTERQSSGGEPGCDEVQGHYINRPLPADDVAVMCARYGGGMHEELPLQSARRA